MKESDLLQHVPATGVRPMGSAAKQKAAESDDGRCAGEDCWVMINEEEDFKRINETYQKIAKSKQKFERLIVTKDEALDLFAYNPFKSQLIATKVPDGSRTTVYRNGDLIDLCRGPHLKDTGAIIINELRCRLKLEASYGVSGANDVCRRVVTCNSRADNLMNGQ